MRGMRFSGGENILRFEPRNAGPSVKRRFANGRRERRARFRVRTNTNDEVDSKSWRAHLPGEKPGLAVRVTAPPLAKPAVAVSLKDWLAMVPLPLASSCELGIGRAGFRVSHHASRVSERFGAFASRRGVATRPIRRGRFAALELTRKSAGGFFAIPENGDANARARGGTLTLPESLRLALSMFRVVFVCWFGFCECGRTAS